MTNKSDLFDDIFASANKLLSVEDTEGDNNTGSESGMTDQDKINQIAQGSANALTGDVLIESPIDMYAPSAKHLSTDEDEVDWDLTDEDEEVYGIPNEESDMSGDEFDFLDELDETIEESLVTSKYRVDDLEDRTLTPSPRAFELSEDVEDKYQQVIENVNSGAAHIDTDSELPNIGEEVLDTYIVMRGIYSPAFKEHILNSPVVTDGDFPICIEVKGKVLVYRRINPDPRTLFYLIKVFKGWDIKFVDYGEERDINLMQFLGRVPIGVG